MCFACFARSIVRPVSFRRCVSKEIWRLQRGPQCAPGGSVENGVEERRGKIVAAPTTEGRCWDLDVLNVTLSSIPAPYAKRYDSAQVDRPNAHLKGNLKMCMGEVLGKRKKGMV